MITIALSKGRIFDETLPLLAAAGITPRDSPDTSRKLIIGTDRADVRLVIVRASDTPTYVQYGAAELGIAPEKIRQGLQAFRRAERRFEILVSEPALEVVDDYAHHPKEVVATWKAAQARGRARIVAIFQPHRYTRLATFMTAFAEALAKADLVVLLPVYAAGEREMEGFGVAELAARPV